MTSARRAAAAADRALAWVGLWAIAAYRAILSPLLGGGCRFRPSCSAYGAEALRRHGGVAGARLAIARILRCRPGGRGGEDPVPGASSRRG